MHKLKWHTGHSFYSSKYERIVKKDLKKLGIIDPSQLSFHMVFLKSSERGSYIFVGGKKGDNKFFHCRFVKNIIWESI